MKVALIPPTHQLPRYGALTNFHLCLAHLVGDDEEYTVHYQKRQLSGDYIIMDNGAYELGSSVSFETLMSAVEAIGAHEIMIPDVFKNRQATVEKAIEFHELLHTTYSKPPWKITVVPQGENEDEWNECLFELMHHRQLKFDGIAVPKHLGEAGRYDAVLGLRALDKYVHVLGCNHIIEAQTFSKWNHVRSIDTSLPFVATYNRVDLRREEIPDEELKRPENYFTLGPERYDVRNTTRNVLTFLDAAGQIY